MRYAKRNMVCDGKLLIYLLVLRKYWPNLVVPFTKIYKGMCFFDKCGVKADAQESLNLKQAKIIKQIKHYVLQMEYVPDKDAYN